MELPASGVIPSRRDVRRFNHQVQFGAASLQDLPPMGIGRKPISIKDQRQTNFCTGFGSAAASEYIEGIEMSPEFQVAKIGEIVGEPILGGAQPKDMIKALRLFGSLPQKDAPFSLSRGDMPSFVADWNNWPAALNQKSDDYLKASSYDVMDGDYDAFDNIRSALWQAHKAGEARVAIACTQWFQSYGNGQGILRRGSGPYTWHCHLLIDWTMKDGELVLVGHNSLGTAFGHGGLTYWSRDAVNQWAESRFTDIQMVRDLTPETAKEAQWGMALIIYDQLVKIDPTGAVKWLVEFVRDILTPKETATLPPAKVEINHESPYRWDTVENARHSVRVICDEEGLTVKQKNDLCATVGAESGWQSYYLSGPKKGQPVKLENKVSGKVWSTDWGICQINDHYHVGKGKPFPSAEYILNNPEACIRWMCKQWKAGNANWWIAFKTGNYRRFL